MLILFLILLIVAAVCFAIAMFNIPVRVNLIAAGLLAWVVVEIIKVAQAIN